MSLPRIAIVGRPNVGKSSLLNMLAGARVSIVDPTPGVTRDRVAAVVEIDPPSRGDPSRLVEVIDTGGYGVYSAEGQRFDDIGEDLSRLSGSIEEQIGEAVRTSDMILFVVDAQSGIMALDRTIAQLLREQAFSEEGGARRSVPVIVVANKTDGDNWEPHALEASALGFGEPLMVSATSRHLKRQFLERLYELLPPAAEDEAAPEEPEMKFAIVGKRNAGKSTFVNALAGEERVIVSEIAGTTRDAVDVRIEMDGKKFLAIDTAGFRKRKSLADQVEWYSTHRALRSIRRADVVLLLIDATVAVSQVDKQLAGEVREQFKPAVIVVNKWDLARSAKNPKGRPITIEDYRTYLEKELKALSKSPIVFTSATDGTGVRDAVAIAEELFEQSRQRVSTSRLNDIMRSILEQRGPSSKLGTKAKILYTTQVSTAPPTIVLVVNHREMFTPEYERYILNRLAEETPFEEIPIRLVIKDRQRARIEDLKAQGRSRKRSEGGEARDDDAPDIRTPGSQARPPKMPRVVSGLAEDGAEITDPEEAEMMKRWEQSGE